MHPRRRPYLTCTLLALAVALPVLAVVHPEDTPIRSRIFRHDHLLLTTNYLAGSEVQAPLASQLASLAVAPGGAYFDANTGRWATLMPATPLIPGIGVGNDLSWDGLTAEPPYDAAGYERAAWDAFVSYLNDHQGALRFDVDQLTAPGHVTAHEGGGLVQINAPRQVGGIPVRDSFIHAVIRHGNLVLLGSRNWGDLTTASKPSITAEEAQAAVRTYLDPLAARSSFKKSSLAFVPTSGDATGGNALGYRLAWVVHPVIPGDYANWEALVDAHSGELLLFEDQNHYGASSRVVQGGVLPETNDGVGPEGTEQAGWPMPFADLENNGDTLFTDAGGNLLACVDGTITTRLSGRYMNMNDNCGPIEESTAGDVLDLGTSPGTDCAVPPGASAGNTHASRSGFYEMNRVQEQARGQLPGNSWLDETLTANMNIPQSCNAFWSGSTVNFYRSGGGCGNTGELAGVYDHEWGHGMDDNDANPSISSPGEGIADIYAYLRLNTSCIGRGFLQGANCNGYGDPCTMCDGVRDIDWAKRASGVPHDLDFIIGACGGGGGTPCGGSTHCEGSVYAESLYDLVNRDLPTAGYDFNTALEIGTRLTYLGGGAVGNWFTCSPPFGGCNADGGYLNFLAADDDNGDLTDGTPNMESIFDAFDRHQIACATPTVQNSTCDSQPTSAPAVVATPADRGANLTWGAVAGAAKYKVYRTDGVFGCDFGKTFVGETTGTSFMDSGLKNGREYYYIVIPIGSDDACFGPSSSCTPVTPAAGGNLAIGTNPVLMVAPGSGDGDIFLDNCEEAELAIPMTNIGIGDLTNVQIDDIEFVSHPDSTLLTALPLAVDATMEPCESQAPTINFEPAGLTSGVSIIKLSVHVISDQGAFWAQVVILFATESDFQSFATKTFSFESDEEGWTKISGTFDRTTTGAGSGGGAPATDTYIASSGNLADQCDHIRSPVISLSETSTLELWNNFDIEPFCGTCTPPSWYDRANVGIYDPATNSRTLVEPSGGRDYNAEGANGTCGTDGQRGWADAMTTWATSEFDAVALDAAAIAGQPIQLDIRYGTDPGLHPRGFWFDEVTFTDVSIQAPDTQPNTCGFGFIFGDGFESGDTTMWSNTTP